MQFSKSHAFLAEQLLMRETNPKSDELAVADGAACWGWNHTSGMDEPQKWELR